MASRLPLVVVNGRISQLPSGDTLNAQVNEVDTFTLTNASASAVPIGTPVYISAASACQPARANASGTCELAGLVRDASIAASASGSVQTDGVLTATTTQWDSVTGQTGGLTPGSTYFLSSATAGRLTVTAPTATGEFVTRVGRALSTTDLDITLEPAIAL